MPCADTPVAMDAATMVKMSSTGRVATYRVHSQETIRHSRRSSRNASASPASPRTARTAELPGLSVT